MIKLPVLSSPTARRWLNRASFERPTMKAATVRANSRGRIFFGLLLLPSALATLYYGLIASNRYGSEAEFIVRSATAQKSGGLERLFQSFGLSRTVDDGNAVQSYLLSRDAVRELAARIPLEDMFSRGAVDRLARYPFLWRGRTFESLYDYYLSRVSVVQNSTKGIFSIYAVAFEPADAHRISTELLKLAEEMINRLNARAQEDAIAFARKDLANAGVRLVEAQRKLTDYRNQTQFVDPASTSASMLETITSLSTELASAMAELENLKRVSPANPGIRATTEKVESLRRQIGQQRLRLAGNDTALAAKFAAFDRLWLEQKLAESWLASASQAFDQARQDAHRQAIYLEAVVSPSLPDEPNEPKRLRCVITVFVLSFSGAAVAWLLAAGAREHVIS